MDLDDLELAAIRLGKESWDDSEHAVRSAIKRIAALEAALKTILPYAGDHGDCGSMSNPEGDRNAYATAMATAAALINTKTERDSGGR